MCLPAAALAPLLIASTVMSTAATVYGGIQKAASDRYAAGIAANNALYAQEAAQAAQKAGNTELQDQALQQSEAKGKQRLAMAASGVDLSSGTPLAVQVGTAQVQGLDRQTLLNNTAQRVMGYTIDSGNYSAESKADSAAASGDLFGAALSGAGTLLGGLSGAQKAAAQYGW